MLSDGSDEFLGGEDLEVFLVAAMGHGGAIEDFAGIFDVCDLLFREGVSHDVFREHSLPIAVVSGYAVSDMHTEPAVTPGHELFNDLVANSSFGLQHCQDLGAEDLFELFWIGVGQTMKSSARSEEAVGDNGMEVWMKPGVIAEGVDHHDHAQDAVIEAQHGTKKQLRLSLAQWHNFVRSFRSYLK